MTIATITTNSLSTTVAKTNAQFVDFLSTQYITNLGFTLVDTINGTPEIRVLSYVYNGAKTKGTVFLRLSVSGTGTLTYSIFDSWNANINGGSNQSTECTVTYSQSSGADIIATSYDHPEFKGIVLTQVTTHNIIGLIRPTTIPSWWNENNALYSFMLQNSNFPYNHLNLLTTSGNALGVTQYEILYSLGMVQKQIYTDKFSILKGLLISTGSTGTNRVGLIVKTSEDLGICSISTLNPRDPLVVSLGVEEYEFMSNSTYAPGLVIRKV